MGGVLVEFVGCWVGLVYGFDVFGCEVGLDGDDVVVFGLVLGVVLVLY